MINQKRDLDMITRKIKVEIPTFHYDDLEVSEITTETSWMKLHVSVLFIKDDVQITKELYKDYETGLWYYIKSDGMIISHKDTFNHTIKNLIDEMIYDCHLEMEEVAKESEETDKTEYCESTNNDIKGHIYIDTDSVKVAPLPEQQTGEESIIDTIIADDNIAYQTAKQSVIDVMKCLMCPADREGNRCGGKQWCKQTWKRYDAIVNPEWHHVSLATLANIDFDMLDEKRKLVLDINQILKDGIRNLYKCENHISFEVLERYVIRKCDELIRRNRLKAFWFSYIARQLDEVRRNTIYLYTPYITAHRNRW